MEVEPVEIVVRFVHHRKKKVRKIAVKIEFEEILKKVKTLFPEIAEEDGLELYYQEYSIESGDDWESAVDEFRSESKETFWFDLKIVNPNAPPPPTKEIILPPPSKVSLQPSPVHVQQTFAAQPQIQQHQPPPAQKPQPVAPASGLTYTPHKHLGQMNSNQRYLHKIVWALRGMNRWATAEDIKNILPGKKKPSLHLIRDLIGKGIPCGYFLCQGPHYLLGHAAIPFDSFCGGNNGRN